MIQYLLNEHCSPPAPVFGAAHLCTYFQVTRYLADRPPTSLRTYRAPHTRFTHVPRARPGPTPDTLPASGPSAPAPPSAVRAHRFSPAEDIVFTTKASCKRSFRTMANIGAGGTF